MLENMTKMTNGVTNGMLGSGNGIVKEDRKVDAAKETNYEYADTAPVQTSTNVNWASEGNGAEPPISFSQNEDCGIAVPECNPKCPYYTKDSSENNCIHCKAFTPSKELTLEEELSDYQENLWKESIPKQEDKPKLYFPETVVHKTSTDQYGRKIAIDVKGIAPATSISLYNVFHNRVLVQDPQDSFRSFPKPVLEEGLYFDTKCSSYFKSPIADIYKKHHQVLPASHQDIIPNVHFTQCIFDMVDLSNIQFDHCTFDNCVISLNPKTEAQPSFDNCIFTGDTLILTSAEAVLSILMNHCTFNNAQFGICKDNCLLYNCADTFLCYSGSLEDALHDFVARNTNNFTNKKSKFYDLFDITESTFIYNNQHLYRVLAGLTDFEAAPTTDHYATFSLTARHNMIIKNF